MPAIKNPALIEFVAQLGPELLMAQVFIRRTGDAYELRHVDDQNAPTLRAIPFNEARALAQTTASGEFRPLKSAPNLLTGWLILARTAAELETALSQLYPGAIPDWFAARSATPPVTDYRAYVNRQSGMYRITTLLTDPQAAQVIQSVCDRHHCLKRRFWSVAGLSPDAPAGKSLIPCLEPCAVLMESARQTVRTLQQS